MSSFHRRENRKQEETDRDPGLHKDAGHAYSQDVLSFMLGREGESVYTWKNIKGNKQKMGTILRKTQKGHTPIPPQYVGWTNKNTPF